MLLDPGLLAELERLAQRDGRHTSQVITSMPSSPPTAERMNARRVYTLDREHFERIRPEHVDRFELLPAG